jgi:hypothetical protein
VLKAESYAEALERTGGVIAEFVNPKVIFPAMTASLIEVLLEERGLCTHVLARRPAHRSPEDAAHVRYSAKDDPEQLVVRVEEWHASPFPCACYSLGHLQWLSANGQDARKPQRPRW